MKRSCSIFACVLLGALFAGGQEVPNPSFEIGQGDVVAGWTLSAQPGAVVSDTHSGQRAIAVTGDGDSANHWLSEPIDFSPGGLYAISYWAKGDALPAGGTAVTGPLFANVDIGSPPAEWKHYRQIAAAPSIGSARQPLRFGQWHLSGTVMFDDIAIQRAEAIHHQEQGAVLGEGERISVNEYIFLAPFTSHCRNHSRPLYKHNAGFNSNRWVFGQGAEVVYCHDIAGREQLAASLTVNIGYYVGGQLVVAVSKDGQNWQPLGQQADKGVLTLELPKELFPAQRVFISLKAEAAKKVGAADSDPGSFQIHSYEYKASVSGSPTEIRGSTRYIHSSKLPDAVDIAIVDIGDSLPGGKNQAQIAITNRRAQAIAVVPSVTVSKEGAADVESTQPSVSIPAGASQTVVAPYQVSGIGEFNLSVELKGDISYKAEMPFTVPLYFDDSYGDMLRDDDGHAALWWASSGWKIPVIRALPRSRGRGLRISAARREAEAAQLVIRASRDLAGVTVSSSDLVGPNGAVISRDRLDLLRVHYSDVTMKTDPTSVAGLWPDALPPILRPMSIAAGCNQPLWVRVRVPEDAVAGQYQAMITLRAEGGWKASVPLSVEVFPFTLPKTMTCETAFGFNPSLVWRYQKIDDPAQRREVLQKYWQNFSEHHIWPYNPAPFSQPKVTLDGKLGRWQGGTRDRSEKASGESSLYIRDESTTSSVSARYAQAIAIPAEGVTLRFKYKTAEPGHIFVATFTHNDKGNAWMYGRNRDMRITGDGTWQSFEQRITQFPENAASFHLVFWGARWTESGDTTGAVWVDDVELIDNQSGQQLIEDGGFEPLPKENLRVHIDWSDWDQEMAENLSRFGFNGFRMNIMGLGGGTFHARHEPSLFSFTEDTPEYELLMADYLGQVHQHLSEKGWLDKAYVYWFDEPDKKDYEFVMNGFRKLKTYAPGLRRMLTEQVEDELIGGPNLWCPLTPHVTREQVEERNQQGERFWWYVCTGPKAPYATLFIDHPGTEMRVWLWQTWAFGIDGILVWASNYWTSGAAYPDPNAPQNPYLDPMGWVSGYATDKGVKRPWGNGDGRFVYPPEAAADGNPAETVLDGPVDSIRWEMLRDGIEDYEYMAILKRLISEQGDRLTQARRDELNALLTVPESISTSLTKFTTDPAPIEEHREKLARAIASLSAR
ncbi:MAG: hypothetical protein BWX73_01624 [Lentisphaerae bacterium ADurb.Bin082]|nr:MAG: hypothetical protein BWX73_01624 [Lentisphaerae bacterium ADurb.Bin082]